MKQRRARTDRGARGADADRRLSRLLMVRAGETEPAQSEILLGGLPVGLSAQGRRHVEALKHYWEWADGVVSSPVVRALDTARILAGRRSIRIDPDLRARELGSWEGRPGSELTSEDHRLWLEGDLADLPGAEPAQSDSERAQRFWERVREGPCASLLVVSHQSTIRRIAQRLGAPLPAGRPLPAEMILLTRRRGPVWSLGRRSSDPPALRSPLERTGMSGAPDARRRDRDVGRLEIRVDGCGVRSPGAWRARVVGAPAT